MLEVKFDGWRTQLHKDGEAAKAYSRNGNDLTRRFAGIRSCVDLSVGRDGRRVSPHLRRDRELLYRGSLNLTIFGEADYSSRAIHAAR
jgi:hypothetical protein